LKIAIIIFSLNVGGGAEKLCLEIIEALKKHGHETTLVTMDKTDWKSLRWVFGDFTMPDHEFFLPIKNIRSMASFAITAWAIFATYLMLFIILKVKSKYDLILNSYGYLLNSIADITYINGISLRASLKYPEIRPLTYDSKMWNIYLQLYFFATNILNRLPSIILLSNSNFTKDILEKSIKIQSTVVYPPVNLNQFIQLDGREKKEDLVVTVTRYSQSKNLEIVPLIAKYVKNASFLIVGSANEQSLETIQKLEKLIKDLKVENRVKLLINIPHSSLIDVVSRAKVYLHTMRNEAFGISVVEAMASFCVPVVPLSGGPWLDILDEKQGEYGYAYETPQEAAKYIEMIIANENKRKQMCLSSFDRAKKFDKEVFQEKIVNVCEKVYDYKRGRKR